MKPLKRRVAVYLLLEVGMFLCGQNKQKTILSEVFVAVCWINPETESMKLQKETL